MSKRRATMQEFADYFNVRRQTVIEWKKKYNGAFKKNRFDSKDIYSVFDFFKYLLNEKI